MEPGTGPALATLLCKLPCGHKFEEGGDIDGAEPTEPLKFQPWNASSQADAAGQRESVTFSVDGLPVA